MVFMDTMIIHRYHMHSWCHATHLLAYSEFRTVVVSEVLSKICRVT